MEGRQSTVTASMAILAAGAHGADVARILDEHSIPCRRLDPAQLPRALEGEFAAAFLTSETLPLLDMTALERALEAQPAWRNFSFILLVDPGWAGDLAAVQSALGSLVLLDRPLNPVFLVNSARAALRAHARQCRVQEQIRLPDCAEERLRQVIETLETRVRERMRELAEASARLRHDADERKATQEMLRESEELYRYTLELGRHIVWTAGPDGAFLTMSPRFTEMTGGTAATPPEELIHPEDIDGVMTAWINAVATGKPHYVEFRMRVLDGSYRMFLSRAAPRRDENGRIVRWYGFTEDIHDQRQEQAARLQGEAELRRLQAELIHISRVSAMGTMASTLAHELNQPLTAVSSYISGSRRLLDDPSPSHDQVREALRAAESAALRGGLILRRLREFVSRGNVSVRPEKLVTLVQEACDLGFVGQRLLGVTHKVKLDETCGWVLADRIQVQQVLINLIRNAVQAMDEAARKEVVISSACGADGMVEISVADTGSGIAPEAREALFSPFQSSKADGMGIGLSISRTIVEAHGGKIWARDSPGGGAVFRFTLPLAEEPRDP